MSRGDRGFTLLEALVAAALTVLMLGLVAGFLVPSMRAAALGTSRAEMQQQAVLAVQRLAEDLQRTVGAGVGLLPADPARPDAPVAVGIVRLQGITAEGQQVWEEKAMVYFWDRSSRRLYRRTWPPEPPSGLAGQFSASRPVRLGPDILERICEERSGAEAVVAFGVRDFQVTHGGPGTSVSPPLTVILEVERDVPGKTERERFRHVRSVAFRNAL